MYAMFYTIRKLFFLYVVFFIAAPLSAMLGDPELLNLQHNPYNLSLVDSVAAYSLPQHIAALAKSSQSSTSVIALPTVVYEQKNDNDTVLFINYFWRVMRALPQEERFTVQEGRRQEQSIYDCRKLYEVLKSGCSVCPSCLEKKAVVKEKKQNKIKPAASPLQSVTTNQALIILGTYGLICFSLGGSLVYLCNHFLKH